MAFWFTPKEAYDKFLGLVGQGVAQTKRKSIASKFDLPKSPEERLRALVQLHKDGLIDDFEFEQKRKEILGPLKDNVRRLINDCQTQTRHFTPDSGLGKRISGYAA